MFAGAALPGLGSDGDGVGNLTADLEANTYRAEPDQPTPPRIVPSPLAAQG